MAEASLTVRDATLRPTEPNLWLSELNLRLREPNLRLRNGLAPGRVAGLAGRMRIDFGAEPPC